MTLTSDMLAITRRHAEQLMTSTCTIRGDAPGEPTTNPQSGEVTPAVGPVVYTGKCRVRPAGTQGTTSEAGGAELFTFDYLISVPFAVTGAQEGQQVTVDSSPDPALVGVKVLVEKVDRGEHITARRLSCSEVA